MNLSSTLGGLAGACALTLLNESVKKIDQDAPRLDLLGQNALAKLMKGKDIMPRTVKQVFPVAGDLITNSLYYGMTQGKSPQDTFFRGAVLGLSAGVGAVVMPKQLGLEEAYTGRTTKTKLMTVALYFIGGLVAAAITNALEDKKKLHEGKIADSNEALKSAMVTTGKEIGKQIAHTV